MPSIPLSLPPSFPLPTTGYLRLPDVLRVIPVSRSTWWHGVATGRYPKGVKLSERTTAWRAEDIRALMATLNGSAPLADAA